MKEMELGAWYHIYAREGCAPALIIRAHCGCFGSKPVVGRRFESGEFLELFDEEWYFFSE